MLLQPNNYYQNFSFLFDFYRTLYWVAVQNFYCEKGKNYSNLAPVHLCLILNMCILNYHNGWILHGKFFYHETIQCVTAVNKCSKAWTYRNQCNKCHCCIWYFCFRWLWPKTIIWFSNSYVYVYINICSHTHDILTMLLLNT